MNTLTQRAPLAAMRATTASGVCSAASAPGRQRMLACVRGLVDVVREDLVSGRSCRRTPRDNRRRRAAPHREDVRVLLLGSEPGNLLGDVGRVEHLRHAEEQIIARLLRKELRLEAAIAGSLLPNGMPMACDTWTWASMMPGSGICQCHPAGVRRWRRDGLVAHLLDATRANEHVSIAQRLRLFGRDHRDVFDYQDSFAAPE